MAPLTRPARWAPWLTVSGLLLGGVFCSPSQIEIVDAGCEVLQHDGEPWIVPPERLHGYCDPAGSLTESRWTRRAGSFEVVRHDELTQVDPAFWDRLDSTFKCNLAHFGPENVVLRDGGGISLRLEAHARNDRAVTAGSIATKDADEARYLFGRFETVMKPAKISGVISAFFLYRFDPWQEIDAEFLGRDTSKLLANVYYNPGVEGDLYNYGFAGTPVLVDLGFDAAEDFHRYAIEWEPGEIRWFVDGRLLHSRPAGRPTPVPHLPMRFHVNTWPTCGESLAGRFSTDELPKATDVRSIEISTWEPSRLGRLAAYVGSVFAGDEDPHDWRDSATWVQPGR
jgi:beta-glucanase (GH16 family)